MVILNLNVLKECVAVFATAPWLTTGMVITCICMTLYPYCSKSSRASTLIVGLFIMMLFTGAQVVATGSHLGTLFASIALLVNFENIKSHAQKWTT